MKELNPNHRTTSGLHDHWHKLAAIVLHKYRHALPAEVVVTSDDIHAFIESGATNIVADDQRDGLHLRLVNDSEAAQLAKRAGGLPS